MVEYEIYRWDRIWQPVVPIFQFASIQHYYGSRNWGHCIKGLGLQYRYFQQKESPYIKAWLSGCQPFGNVVSWLEMTCQCIMGCHKDAGITRGCNSGDMTYGIVTLITTTWNWKKERSSRATALYMAMRTTTWTGASIINMAQLFW